MAYTVPQYELHLTKNGQTHNAWYRFFQNVWAGAAPSNEVTIQFGPSPFAYTAPSKGFVMLKGGTVSAVQFTRSVTTLTGQTSGIFPVNQGDVLTVTFSALPSMVFVPQ